MSKKKVKNRNMYKEGANFVKHGFDALITNKRNGHIVTVKNRAKSEFKSLTTGKDGSLTDEQVVQSFDLHMSLNLAVFKNIQLLDMINEFQLKIIK